MHIGSLQLTLDGKADSPTITFISRFHFGSPGPLSLCFMFQSSFSRHMNTSSQCPSSSDRLSKSTSCENPSPKAHLHICMGLAFEWLRRSRTRAQTNGLSEAKCIFPNLRLGLARGSTGAPSASKPSGSLLEAFAHAPSPGACSNRNLRCHIPARLAPWQEKSPHHNKPAGQMCARAQGAMRHILHLAVTQKRP